MDAPELKPCPFCAGRAIYHKDHTTECVDSIYCEACDATVSDFNLLGPQGSCRELWNTRADIPTARMAELEAENARLRGALSIYAATVSAYARDSELDSDPAYDWLHDDAGSVALAALDKG